LLPDSPLLGRRLGDLDLTEKVGARIIIIERGSGRARRLLPRTDDSVLEAGDTLLIDMDDDTADVDELCAAYGVSCCRARAPTTPTGPRTSAWWRSCCPTSPPSSARPSPRQRRCPSPS
jgi:hypothetical protein